MALALAHGANRRGLKLALADHLYALRAERSSAILALERRWNRGMINALRGEFFAGLLHRRFGAGRMRNRRNEHFLQLKTNVAQAQNIFGLEYPLFHLLVIDERAVGRTEIAYTDVLTIHRQLGVEAGN